MTIQEEIATERKRQDAKYGGPEHDDEHFIADWGHIIGQRTDAMKNHNRLSPVDARKLLIEIAAVAQEAIESYDRTNK